jgi:Holliday junction resolvase RusA-like endonuclease
MIRRTFTVPGNPHGKERARTVTQGGRAHSYTPQKTVLYERLVRDSYNFTYPGEKPFTGPVELKITAYMPIPTSWSVKAKQEALAEIIKPTVKPDGSNILKSIEDGLNGIAYIDDKQITLAQVEKKYGPARVEVEIWSAQ